MIVVYFYHSKGTRHCEEALKLCKRKCLNNANLNKKIHPKNKNGIIFEGPQPYWLTFEWSVTAVSILPASEKLCTPFCRAFRGNLYSEQTSITLCAKSTVMPH